MALFRRGDVSIYYEVYGSGYPLLLLPPGSMSATIDFWQQTAFHAPYALSDHFRVIAVDERNAGRSAGPIEPDDPWGMYLDDHVGLLNHLGIERCHVLGCCIGAASALKMAVAAPERVTAAVLEQPIGVTAVSRELYRRQFSLWSEHLMRGRPDMDLDALERFRRNMWDGDFVLSVSREAVCGCLTPLLVLPGVDDNHPNTIGHEVYRLSPNAELLEPWKVPASILPATVTKIRDFLSSHTPQP